jgi:hypothetical protein
MIIRVIRQKINEILFQPRPLAAEFVNLIVVGERPEQKV